MSKRRSASAERLHKARRQASRELKLPTADWRCKRYALLMCAHDNATARLANGADINVDSLLRLDQAMAEVRASVPQEPIKVTVEIVDSNPQLLGPPPSPDPPPSTPPPPTETSPAPSAPTSNNVVPLRREVGSIHDQPGAPLKRLQNEPWRQFVGPVGDSYGSVGAAPDFGACHVLPSPYDPGRS